MRSIVLMIACAAPAAAQDFELAQPIDCVADDTCYIQNYVDHDPTDAASDFRCGSLTYDGHKGTDFGLNSLADMRAGVAVLAAAAGTVRGVRNNMRDVLYTPDLAGEINGRDCGNGLVIAHGDGWETQYCHMREGSVAVLPGDQVSTGDTLGLVGLSGRTQFPHLHISVRRDGNVVDPFAPDGSIVCDAPPTNTLWDDTIQTPAGGLLNSGFSNAVPSYEAVMAGVAGVPDLTGQDPIVLWAFLFGAQSGDIISLSFRGPDGQQLFETDEILDRTQALAFRAGGLNPPNGAWAEGTYTGSVTHLRNGEVLDTMVSTQTLR